MEILNLLVGFELIIVGISYFMKYDIASAASWSIFGCMYIVMDKYSAFENSSRNREVIEIIKYYTAYLAFAISTVFLIYLINQHWFL